MADRMPKSLPHVQLHPVHGARKAVTQGLSEPVQGAPSPSIALKALRPERLPYKCRKEALADMLQKLLSSEPCNIDKQDSHAHQVSLNDAAIVIDNSGSMLHIPLLLTDVVAAVLPENHGVGYLVAVAPRHEAARHEVVRSPAQLKLSPGSEDWKIPLQDVWIFTAAGDYIDLNQLLFDLGGRGALRWDLRECYTVMQRALGEGGSGKVFLGQSLIVKEAKAMQRQIGESSRDAVRISQVAIKCFNECQSEKAEDAIWKEIGFLARASGHPNIVTLFGQFGECKQTKQGMQSHEDRSAISWFIVMELFGSGDLFDVLEDHTLTSNELIVLMVGLSSALKHLHALRIVHRDVKPENILMGAHLQPILADMGIAADLDDAVNMSRVCGSPGYAAPEIVSGQCYSELVDIFGAGCVYYFALTGNHPFQGKTKEETAKRTVIYREKYHVEYFCHVSSGIKQLIKSCLSKRPDHRPSAQQCLDALPVVENRDLMQHLVSEGASGGPHFFAGTGSQNADQLQAEVAFLEPQEPCHQGESTPETVRPDMGSPEAVESSWAAAGPSTPAMGGLAGRVPFSAALPSIGAIAESEAPEVLLAAPLSCIPAMAAPGESSEAIPSSDARDRSGAGEVSSGAACSSSCAIAGPEAAQAPPSIAVPSDQLKQQQIMPSPSSHSLQKQLRPHPPPEKAHKAHRFRLRLPVHRSAESEHTAQQKKAVGQKSMFSSAWRWFGRAVHKKVTPIAEEKRSSASSSVERATQ